MTEIIRNKSIKKNIINCHFLRKIYMHPYFFKMDYLFLGKFSQFGWARQNKTYKQQQKLRGWGHWTVNYSGTKSFISIILYHDQLI